MRRGGQEILVMSLPTEEYYFAYLSFALKRGTVGFLKLGSMLKGGFMNSIFDVVLLGVYYR